MSEKKTSIPQKVNLPHEAILLSKVISEKLNIQLIFLDAEVIHDNVKWHTPYHIGLKSGKVINKAALKYWEVVQDE